MFKAQIIGNLGNDAQSKVINGVEYVSFDVAHSYKVGEKEATIWISCLLRGRGRVMDYLKKGTKVYVSGDLSGNIYDSSHYRCKMIGYTVFVDTLQLCSPKQEEKPVDNSNLPFEESDAAKKDKPF